MKTVACWLFLRNKTIILIIKEEEEEEEEEEEDNDDKDQSINQSINQIFIMREYIKGNVRGYPRDPGRSLHKI